MSYYILYLSLFIMFTLLVLVYYGADYLFGEGEYTAIFYNSEGEIVEQLEPERLRELERKEKELDALYCAGVDNWEGYDIAMGQVEDEEHVYGPEYHDDEDED